MRGPLTMSSDTRSTLDNVRQIVQQSGYSYRVNDDQLRRIVESPNPQSVCEDIVRGLGGHPSGYQRIIGQIVAAVQAGSQGSPQDAAPATSESPDLAEIADRLRTFAAGQGLPASMVEEALVYSGLVQPEPEPEDDDVDVEGATQEAINTAILSTLKKMNKRLKGIEKSL